LSHDPLSAFDLAKSMRLTVWSTDEIEDLPVEDLHVLNNRTDDSWAALTLRMGVHHLVIYKNGSSKPRINSVVMHEISHITLGHELAEACILEDGSLVPSNFSQDQEDEANWLAGTLLLPRPALISIRNASMSDQQAQEQYLVSSDMLIWRTRMTGVDYQLGGKPRK
jgi:Zn-dependent peptidase ImmA (M78 family)